MNRAPGRTLARRLIVASAAAAALCLTGCGDGDEEAPCTPAAGADIEIAGSWESNFGSAEEIDGASWSGAHLVEFDNCENEAITQNPDDAEFSPGLYNRLVWTEPSDGTFYYCTVSFNLDSLEAARASTSTADASDPETTGCGDFSWTRLSAR